MNNINLIMGVIMKDNQNPENRFEQILKKNNVYLSPEHKTLVNDLLHVIGVLDSYQNKSESVIKKLVPNMETRICNTLSTLLEQNPELQKSSKEICDLLENSSKKDKTKELLKEWNKVTIDKYKDQQPQQDQQGNKSKDKSEDEVQKYLDSITKDLKTLARDLVTKIGPKNSREFVEKIEKIEKEQEGTSLDQRKQKMVEGLESLGKWADEKVEIQAKSSIFSKIGNIIKSCSKAAISFISGDCDTAARHIESAKQSCAEISSKKLFQGLDDIKSKSSSWVENIKEGNFNQKGSSRQ